MATQRRVKVDKGGLRAVQGVALRSHIQPVRNGNRRGKVDKDILKLIAAVRAKPDLLLPNRRARGRSIKTRSKIRVPGRRVPESMGYLPYIQEEYNEGVIGVNPPKPRRRRHTTRQAFAPGGPADQALRELEIAAEQDALRRQQIAQEEEEEEEPLPPLVEEVYGEPMEREYASVLGKRRSEELASARAGKRAVIPEGFGGLARSARNSIPRRNPLKSRIG